MRNDASEAGRLRPDVCYFILEVGSPEDPDRRSGMTSGKEFRNVGEPQTDGASPGQPRCSCGLGLDGPCQGNTFNPYGNSGYADYREFSTPMYSNNPALPGQSRLDNAPIISRNRANSFQQYTDSLDGRDAGAAPSITRGSSAGVPYYQTYRKYDETYNRVYRPNTEADQGFEKRLKQRDEAYAKAMEEKDPTKRAKLLRQLEQDSLDRRPSAASRARKLTAPVPPGSSTATGATATTRAPSPYAAPSAAARRAPSPYLAPTRPSAPGASGRAPAPSTRAPSVTRPSTINPPPDPSTIATPAPR